MEILARRIIGGTYAENELLPTEGLLCAELAVGRSSLREAVRVLVDKGLLVVKPRIGTRVMGAENWKQFDPDIIAWSANVKPDPNFLRSLFEVRTIVEPAAAELAARRASGSDIANIESGYNDMVAGWQAQDLTRLVEADIRFHKAILESTKNPVLMELGSLIEAALRSAFKLTNESSKAPVEALEAHKALLEAIRLRDEEVARKNTLEILKAAQLDLPI
ncbi:FadR/GntR family transcriptional regulator [Rhizobium acidisoli]|nr:FadR/GntR family transcriptional regulator [Rhizobium acidisoli]